MYRAGIIGCGRMGVTIDEEIAGGYFSLLPYSHAAAYAEAAGVELVAAADTDPSKLERVRRQFGVNSLYEDAATMLAKETLDIVSVTTHAPLHAEVTIAAAKAGAKAVFCEKAISCSLAEADEMIACCRERGAVLAINCTRRWDPWFAAAKEFIEEGAIGAVASVVVNATVSLSHMGSHVFDLIRYYAGSDPKWVFGHLHQPEKADSDEDIIGSAFIMFENGVQGIANSRGGAACYEFDILGEKGRIRATANGSGFEFWTLDSVRPGSRQQMPVLRPFPRPQRMKSPTLRAIEDILHCIESGSEPTCNGEDGRFALEIGIAARESHRRGGVAVSLPLPERSLRIISR